MGQADDEEAAAAAERLRRREKVGLARVLECIEATMWQSLVTVSRQQQGGGRGRPEQQQRAGADAAAVKKGKPTTGLETLEPSEDGATSQLVVSGLMKQQEEEEDGGLGTNLDDLVDQIRDMKRTSTDITDDSERREKASRLALRLAEALGILGGDNDEEDDHQ